MNRFDYAGPSAERRVGIAAAALTGEPLRLPIVSLAAALLFVGGTWSVEAHRIAALDADLVTIAHRAQNAANDERRAGRLTIALATIAAVHDRISQARQSALTSTNTIARIGNALPPQTWLTGLQTAPSGSWSIAGRTTSIGEIGTTLGSIGRTGRSATTRLVSITAIGPAGRTLDFVIARDVQP